MTTSMRARLHDWLADNDIALANGRVAVPTAYAVFSAWCVVSAPTEFSDLHQVQGMLSANQFAAECRYARTIGRVRAWRGCKDAGEPTPMLPFPPPRETPLPRRRKAQ